MKRIIALVLVFSMCLPLCACGKSKAAKEAEAAIDAIGEVSINSGDAIKNAEKLYGILTDAEKADVDNRLVLVEAQEKYAELQSEIIYKNAKNAYEHLKEVAAKCVSGMDDVYGAWWFGVYRASDKKYQSFMFSKLAVETPNLTSKDLEAAADYRGWADSRLKNSWQNCLNLALVAIALRGDYETIKGKMLEAEKILQELTTTYEDYTYYPKLKEYYAAVNSYVEFYISPTGSFNQLAGTVKEFENSIRTYEADVGFLFSK